MLTIYSLSLIHACIGETGYYIHWTFQVPEKHIPVSGQIMEEDEKHF